MPDGNRPPRALPAARTDRSFALPALPLISRQARRHAHGAPGVRGGIHAGRTEAAATRGGMPPLRRQEQAGRGADPATREEKPAPRGREAASIEAQPRRWTLRQRLALVYGAVALVILLGAGVFTWWQADALSARNTELALAETRRMAGRVASALAQARQGTAVLAAADPLALGPEGCTALLNAAHLRMDASVGHLFAVGPDRSVTCSTLPSTIGQRLASPSVLTVELTGRGLTGALSTSTFGLGQVIELAEPIRREGLRGRGAQGQAPGAPLGGTVAGVVAATVSLDGLRSASRRFLPEIEGLQVWLLDASGSSASLVGPDAPLPSLPEALHASYLARIPVDAGVASNNGHLLIQVRATDDLSLLASIPSGVVEAGNRADIVLPPLLLVGVLLVGMGALFWSAQRFVVAPLEAATQRLEAAGDIPPPALGAESGAADVADLIRRLGATREAREEAIRLRDTLLREAHHRIKNHLSLVASFLRLQERQLSDHAALQALRAAQGRMVAIGLTYELLQEGTGQTVALDGMLERFARALAARDTTEGGGNRIITDLEHMEVPADIAVKIALVVNELATNALKYAFVGGTSGCVRIALRRAGEAGGEAGGFILHIADDGIGMEPEGRRGLGMNVVDTLIRSIDARIERLPGPGTAFVIAWSPVPDTPRPLPDPLAPSRA
ncbi:sensor histidine kinase [Muricoccus aerilatus]|uniref:sensor histidine kinase n=1 Tax=Muricoccus aerilatus TaxID=452982 RepID=UPI0005C17A7E|nr:sensor histidine kinase [Roseomonas aerilata]